MFDIEGGKIKLSASSLAIPPFLAFYNIAKDKAKALKEIEYVIWLYKWNTQYLAYPPSERASRVGKDVMGDAKYKPSKEVIELIIRFNEFLDTPLIRMYKSGEVGLEYVVELLNSLKQRLTDDQDLTLEQLLKIGAGITKLLKDVEPIAKSLDSAKKRAMAEEVETGKVKGGGTIGLYEIPRSR